MKRAATLLGALAVAALAAARLLPSFASWHQEDDLRNLRWVMEHRDAPWVALTELHALHDHVRPLTLLATWAGAMLSDGAWWGPHGVHLALAAAGLAGVGALAARLSGSAAAGLLAATLLALTPAFGLLPWWNAWICSAGELALGTWALVAAHRALVAGRLPWVGLALVVGAALFKEPGAVLYPLAMAAMALSNRERLPPGWPRAVGPVLPLATGAAAFALTWHPANAGRAAAELPAQVLDFLSWQAPRLVSAWPLGEGLSEGLGLPALLVGVALAAAAVGHRAAALPLGLALTVALVSPVAGPALLVGLVVALVRPAPRPGAALALAGLAVMAPFPNPNPVQVLGAAAGLSVLVAVELAGLAGARGARWALPTAAALTLLPAAVFAHASGGLAAQAPAADRLRARDAFLGVGAVAQAINARQVLAGDPLDDRILAPLLGLELLLDDAPWAPLVELPGPAWLPRGGGAAWPAPEHLLGGLDLPRRSEPSRPRPGRTLDDSADGTRPLDVAPGLYALGVDLERLAAPGAELLSAADACGGRWSVHAPERPEVRLTVRVLRLTPGCGPLRLTAGDTLPGRPFLAPLAEPTLSLRGASLRQALVQTGDRAPTLGGGDFFACADAACREAALVSALRADPERATAHLLELPDEERLVLVDLALTELPERGEALCEALPEGSASRFRCVRRVQRPHIEGIVADQPRTAKGPAGRSAGGPPRMPPPPPSPRPPPWPVEPGDAHRAAVAPCDGATVRAECVEGLATAAARAGDLTTAGLACLGGNPAGGVELDECLFRVAEATAAGPAADSPARALSVCALAGPFGDKCVQHVVVIEAVNRALAEPDPAAATVRMAEVLRAAADGDEALGALYVDLFWSRAAWHLLERGLQPEPLPDEAVPHVRMALAVAEVGRWSERDLRFDAVSRLPRVGDAAPPRLRPGGTLAIVGIMGLPDAWEEDLPGEETLTAVACLGPRRRTTSPDPEVDRQLVLLEAAAMRQPSPPPAFFFDLVGGDAPEVVRWTAARLGRSLYPGVPVTTEDASPLVRQRLEAHPGRAPERSGP